MSPMCGGHGFDPWSGKIPRATEQLSLCTLTVEPVLKSPRAATPEACPPQSLCSARSHCSEKPTHSMKGSSQLTATRGEPKQQ